MRCKSCGYSLWNIKARQCPECGASFRPSEHEFAPGKVQFCCPHCDQPYYGTTVIGHLEPSRFQCVGCQAQLDMDQMKVRPAQGVSEREAMAGYMPWLERGERGLFRSYFVTIGLSLIRPVRVMRGVPVTSSTGQAIAYAVTTTMMILTVGAFLPYLVQIWWYFYSWGEFYDLAGYVAWFLAMMAAVPGLVVLWPLSAHVVLRLTGRCEWGIDRTCHAVCYSAGANAAGLIPCIGPIVGWIWWMVSATLMLRTGQRVHGARAAAAVVLLPACVLGGVGGYYGVSAWVMSQYYGDYSSAQFYEHAATYSLLNSLAQYSWSTDGHGPHHSIELCLTGAQLGSWDVNSEDLFSQFGTSTRMTTIPVGDISLAEFLKLPVGQRLTIAGQLLDQIPSELVAHRFGDFIFTYHGASPSDDDPNLWMVVMLPDPDVNGRPAPARAVLLGTGDMAVEKIAFRELAERMKKQNEYRAAMDLPPLPDLTTVTHGKPAVAGQQPTGDDPNEE